MSRSLIVLLTIALGLGAGKAVAQMSSTQRPLPPPPVNRLEPPLDPGTIQPQPAPRETFGQKVTRCQHYGATHGVPPGEIGQYTRECVNN